MIPNYIKDGDPLNIAWPNSVVDAIKSTLPTPDKTDKYNKTRRTFRPFDITDIKPDGEGFKIKIKPGLYYEHGKNDPIELKYDTTLLSEYPEIPISSGKDLFFNYKEKKVVVENSDIKGNLKLLKFEYIGGGELKIDNIHPYDIDTRNLAPFSPLISNTAGSYFVALTPGRVNERIVSPTGGALNNHEPTTTDENGLKHYAIAADQQLSIKVSVNPAGQIQAEEGEAVELVVEDAESDSTHYVVRCADDQVGAYGVYHYAMISFADDAFKPILCGSHIDHFQDVNTLENTFLAATDGLGRVVKKYDSTEDKFYFRGISQRTESPQINIKEEEDIISVEGNGLSGKLILIEGNQEYPNEKEILAWDDGLITTSEDSTITIKNYVAGDNITIEDDGFNNFTISALVSGLSSEQISLSAGNNIQITNEGLLYTISSTVSAITLSAGENIEIIQDGNNYTISALVSSLSSEQITLSAGENIEIQQDGNHYTISCTLTSETISLSAGPNIEILQDGSNYTISSTLTGADLNLNIEYIYETTSGWLESTGDPTNTLVWRNGLFVGSALQADVDTEFPQQEGKELHIENVASIYYGS